MTGSVLPIVAELLETTVRLAEPAAKADIDGTNRTAAVTTATLKYFTNFILFTPIR